MRRNNEKDNLRHEKEKQGILYYACMYRVYMRLLCALKLILIYFLYVSLMNRKEWKDIFFKDYVN